MIEVTTNPTIQSAIQSAIHRAHQERGKAVARIWSWLFGSR